MSVTSRARSGPAATVPPRRRPTSARLTGFWQFAPFTPGARIVILGVIGVMFAVEAYLRLVGDLPGGVRGFAMPVTATALVGLTLWHPPTGAIGFALLCIAGIAVDQPGRALSAVVLTSGLIVFACGLKMVAAYLAAALAWVAIVSAWPPGLGQWGTLFHLLALLLSVILGWGIRLVVLRNRELRREVAEGDERLQAELRAERSRIADELHDIIAHEISVVAMHAAVLRRTTDPEVRARSEEVIADAARQALADTRRVLQVIHRAPDAGLAEDTSIRSTLDALAAQLLAYGDDAEVRVDELPPLARSIETALIHAARESVTNVMKHTTGPGRTVRLALTAHHQTVTLTVSNVGQAAQTTTSSGYGLARLRERTELLGGTFTAGYESGSWVTRTTLPQH